MADTALHSAARKVLFLEPFSGISGDMMIGALLDLGFSLEELKEKLALLPLKGYHLSAENCNRSGIQATKFDVHEEQHHPHDHDHGHSHHHHHRTFADIRKMIESSGLSAWVKEQSIAAFQKLAEAEGKVHGQPPEEVHFHEVGAVDSIVDIVGTMIAVESFLPVQILSSSINVGQGTLECQHGTYPVPGPAAQELLKGIPIFSNSVTGELTTPTGATLVATLVEKFGARPEMNITASGYGAGTRQTPGNANVLRITLGETGAGLSVSPEDQVVVIDATIDDMSPQVYGYFQEKALAEGALDVYAASIQMKKNRPALKVTCVCATQDLDKLAALIFRETTTIGIRYTIAQRKTLRREFRQVQTNFGSVAMKISLLDGHPVNFVPEFEDCRRLAAEKGVALKEVQAAAVSAYLQSKP
jgi:pyridinium-3,5-bisthiocarboxylic acid mononucleotide nickel chelatase